MHKKVKLMKKITIFLIASIIIFTFSACNVKKAPDLSFSSGISSQENTTDTTLTQKQNTSAEVNTDKTDNHKNSTTEETQTQKCHEPTKSKETTKQKETTKVYTPEEMAGTPEITEVYTSHDCNADTAETSNIDTETTDTSASEIISMKCRVKEVLKSSIIVEKSDNSVSVYHIYPEKAEMKGAVHFSEGDDIIVKFRYPVQETYPMGIPYLVSVEKTK